jgi:ATP-dependent Lhr-like helicase
MIALPELHPAVMHNIVNGLGWSELRPLQQQAIAPILRGDDALLLAPTAGGKTEAAFFPLLSRLEAEGWRGLSVLYVCPLRALLNNLEPRLASYAAWTGRSVGLWHGDTSSGTRRRLAANLPDILLTTPESLEAMLVSTLLTPEQLFSGLRAVVVDEVHAFAGDDRGWHLLAVLERLSRLAGGPLQRIGLSATVGNPDALLTWLQGPVGSARASTVVAPPAAAGPDPDFELDYVGNIDNAATVVAALHAGEKRLVFADSRRSVETLALILSGHGVSTFVSHSSLSKDERRQAERAFAEARDCVIVSTSTLELGIDVGDLDRVIQVGAPRTAASVLQRLGRSGRRVDTSRNLLFLASDDDEFLRAAALLQLVSEDFVEPVVPPPSPRHLLAQQLLALCLQHGRVGGATWIEELGGLPLAGDGESVEIADWLVESGHLDQDSGMLFIGAEAEHRYGRKHFLDLLSVFTAAPQFTILHGRTELGAVDPLVLTRRVEGPRVLALGGRAWTVCFVDWKRRRAFVEPTDLHGTSRWTSVGQPLSYALTDAIRRVLLGSALSGASLTRRATDRLATLREELGVFVHPEATLVVPHDSGQARWWTWAGGRANAVLAATLSEVDPTLVDSVERYDNRYVKLRGDATAEGVRDALEQVDLSPGRVMGLLGADVSPEALKQLKFAELLPPELAVATLAVRGADFPGAALIRSRRVIGRMV